MPATACQKVMPKASTASMPTKIVANSRFGDVHVQNSWLGLAVPVGLGDVLVAAGFDGDDPVPVGPVGGGLGDCHADTVTPRRCARNLRELSAISRSPILGVSRR